MHQKYILECSSEVPGDSYPQIFHEGANGSDNFKYNMKIENKATTDHL